ncbi:MAG: ATPase, T2SS/T4P/T4SS family, partial [Aeromicrobium sp.]
EARQPNIEGAGEITIRDLVRNSLRMRPDRIVVGECRGGEALDMLQAMNTGHNGSISTLHANTPRDAIARLETMSLMAGMDLPMRAIREQVASAVDVIIHLARMRDGSRRITAITEVLGMEGDVVVLQDAFVFDYAAGVDAQGRYRGAQISTGIRPRFTDTFELMGIAYDLDGLDPGKAVN